MSEQAINLTSKLVSTPGEYASLREQAPLVRVILPGTETPTWLITRYEDAKVVLADSRFVRDSNKLSDQGGPSIADQMVTAYDLPDEFRNYFGVLVLSDGEEHARMRSVITRAFTANRIHALRPRLEQLTHDLYKTLSDRGEADLIGELANPLAVAALCELVGIEEADRPKISDYIESIHSGDPTQAVPILTGMVDRCKELIAQRRSEPADDLISTLTRVSDEEGSIGETEIIAILFLLINTGIIPPTRFIADATVALLDHPEQVERLRAEPDLMSTTAVPELLRFTSSVPLGAQLYATEDLELFGVPVKRGEAVTTSLMAVNHDPAEYFEPHKLDLTRELGRGDGHMAFGHGPHYCIGAVLARLLGEVILKQLFVKHEGPSLAVDRDNLQYQDVAGDGLFLLNLPVTFR
ncbi:cytochrome P450 [Halostreptopolyspora alba]|uniref:Cytochrome P450 n=1 Tax=Halostreptopolyspora alba TaxID=2487137 RepID=A0A3N0DRB4_9ACTN|nr:cytochrome P450 [Nocardiopsaceae bacterium YIM 96095]